MYTTQKRSALEASVNIHNQQLEGALDHIQSVRDRVDRLMTGDDNDILALDKLNSLKKYLQRQRQLGQAFLDELKNQASK